VIDFDSPFADSSQEGGMVGFVLVRVSNRELSDRSIKPIAPPR